MATSTQKAAARKNVRKAVAAAKRKKTITNWRRFNSKERRIVRSEGLP